VPDLESGHDTPEAAASATWASAPSANAQVISVDVRSDSAEVVIDTDPSYRDWVYCKRGSGGWVVVTSGNGRNHAWTDPDW
jgi:hypothetical protein